MTHLCVEIQAYVGSTTRLHRERGKSRGMDQHDILVRSLKKVAEDAEGENGGWMMWCLED
jgi:hypothetical protein